MDLEQQLERERNKVRSIQRIAKALGSTLDLDALLHQIVGNITELMNAERSTLYLVDQDRGELWTKVLQADEVKEIRLAIGQGIAGWVAQSGQVVNIEDAYADPRFSPDTDQKTGYRTRSILCMPMRNLRGQTIGVVQVLNKHGGTFTSEDEQLLAALVSQAAIAINNSMLFQSVVRNNEELRQTHRALEQRMTELDLLLEVQQDMSGAKSLDELLERLLWRTSQRMGAEAGSVLLLDDQTGRLYFRGALGSRNEEVRQLSVELGEGIAGWVTQNDQSAVVNHPEQDERHCQALAARVDFFPRNLLCVPLRGQEGVLGAIELLNKMGEDSFDQNDERLLTLIAGRVAQAIDLARYKERQLKEGRLAAIGGLLSGVLHDLRTPMTIISGSAQLMVDSESCAERTEYVEQIQRQFDLMSSMTKEVLAFARGESILLVRKVYLNRFIEEMSELLRHEFEGKGIEVRVDQRYRGIAYFDETKLRRVFQNISRNAAQAMPHGGRFEVGVTTAADQLVVTFSDTGGGIPEEIEDRLFDAFATAGKQDGTGLGLAIVKKIVEDHGGRIGYESTPGQGTSFTICMPLERSTVPAN